MVCHMPLPDEGQENLRWRRACQIFGNGDEGRGRQIVLMLAARLERARTLHPVFAEGAGHGVRNIAAEFHELEFALERETPARQQAEALDVLITALRFVLGEHEVKGGR